MTSAWLNPPPAYEVVDGLHRLGDEVSDRATPTHYPSGDRVSSHLKERLVQLFDAEGRMAKVVRDEVKNLEMILLMTIRTTLEVDTFAQPPTGLASDTESL